MGSLQKDLVSGVFSASSPASSSRPPRCRCAAPASAEAGSERQRGGGEEDVGEEEAVKPPRSPPETKCFSREPAMRWDGAPDHDGSDFHRMLPEMWHPRAFCLGCPGYLGER